MSEVLKQQVGGSHYKKLKYQPIELSYALNLDPAQVNMVKYLSRWKDKDGLKDLEKIKHYADIQSAFGKPRDLKPYYFEEIQKFVDLNGMPQKYYFILKNILYCNNEKVKSCVDEIIKEEYA